MNNEQYTVFTELQNMLGEWQKLCTQANENFVIVENSFKLKEILEKKSLLEERKSSLPPLQSSKLDILIEQFDTAITNLKSNTEQVLKTAIQEKEVFSKLMDEKIASLSNPILKEIIESKKKLTENEVELRCLEHLVDFSKGNPNSELIGSDKHLWETAQFTDAEGVIHIMKKKKNPNLSAYEKALQEGWEEGDVFSYEVEKISHLKETINESMEVIAKLQYGK